MVGWHPVTPTYEERRGPIARRVARLSRVVRWRLKGALKRPRAILVELNWRLGDEIMALPVIDALHEHYPDAAIDVLTHYPDLFRDHPAIRLINPPSPDPDRCILLRGASRKAYRPAVLFQHARLPLQERRPALRYRDWSTPLLLELPEGDAPLVALAPGASWPTKRWPRESWASLAEQLHHEGCRVIVLGQTGEGVSPGADFTGRTTVYDAACLLHACDLAVCCDSGLMHLALAAGTPVVALFGVTDPDFLIRNEPRLTALRSTLACAGFWNHAEHVDEPGKCPEGHACCLDTITVDDVLAAVRARIPRGAP